MYARSGTGATALPFTLGRCISRSFLREFVFVSNLAPVLVFLSAARREDLFGSVLLRVTAFICLVQAKNHRMRRGTSRAVRGQTGIYLANAEIAGQSGLVVGDDRLLEKNRPRSEARAVEAKQSTQGVVCQCVNDPHVHVGPRQGRSMRDSEGWKKDLITITT